MSDIATIWDADHARGDWSVSNGRLKDGDDLATAVLISIFTDRTAAGDDTITDGSGNARGWWGDLARDHPIGSRLWLLERAKETDETALRARDYIAEALQWMIDDGVVGRFDLVVQWIAPATLGVQLVAYKPDGKTISLQFAWTWNGIT